MTKTLLYVCVFILAGSRWGALADSATPSFAVRGVVLQHGTNQPLRHVRVVISLVENPDKQATVTTAEDGRFNFTDVPAGKYNLGASFHGSNRMYEQDGPFSTGIAVGPGLDTEHIVFPLPAPTTLNVRVIDEEGDPVRFAQIFLFRKRVVAGWSRVEQAGQAATNADGWGSLPHLDPGSYVAGASGTPWYVRQQNTVGGVPEQNYSPDEFDVAYPMTYYPSGQEPAAAQAIVLAENQKREIEITLRAVPSVRIAVSGLPAPANPEAPANSVMPSLEVVGPGGIGLPVSGVNIALSGTEGVLQGFAPGSYRLSLWQQSVAQSGQLSQKSFGELPVVARANTSIDARNAVLTRVWGRTTGENVSLADGLTLVLAGKSNDQLVYCRVQHGGAFGCGSNDGKPGNVAPGVYQIQLADSRELYLKSVQVNGGRFIGGLLTVPEGAHVELSVAVSRGVAKLSGIAVKNGHPFSGAMILFVPQSGDPNIEMPRDQSDSDGTFTVQVHPGRYSLIAIDHGRDLEYHNPDVLAPYLAQALQVDFPSAASTPIQVTVQSRK